MAKRKRSSAPSASLTNVNTVCRSETSAQVQGGSKRKPPRSKPNVIDANPDTNKEVLDGQEALRASPDAQGENETFREDRITKKKAGETMADPTTSNPTTTNVSPDSSLSELSDTPDIPVSQPKDKINAAKSSVPFLDPEADTDDLDADPEELSAALSRPPPINSSYLPLPWKGRLGYACLNTYLRNASPPIFSSRTCRIASILENRHPLKYPGQPAHATKNRPDKEQPADMKLGQAFVEGLGLANARDIPKMLRWNDRYGIKFLRLSSEMFPFASHDKYGYNLAPFASEALAEAGRVAAELGHRLTTHPGQFTQLGSPRKEVIVASIRDLEYHAELLTLLKLPDQLDRDAVMILHMGGIFGDKAATLDRFRENYAKLNENIKRRLVLENDDVCYSVHDLLPICEELNIPLVLDYHHHNIVFDDDKIREGTLDIMDLYPRIKATWTRKGIAQKMHYSEPTPGAITGRQRRKHNPRVATLPPCPPDMDLMIEAKDKEQAVFELMRTFKLPGFDTFNDIIPHTRQDENRPWKPPAKKKTAKKNKKVHDGEDIVAEEEPQPPPLVPEEEVGMGGDQGRVYWPPGMEDWLRPRKREAGKKETKAKAASGKPIAHTKATEGEVHGSTRKQLVSPAADEKAISKKASSVSVKAAPAPSSDPSAKKKKKPKTRTKKTKTAVNPVPTPSTSDAHDHDDEDADIDMPDLSDVSTTVTRPRTKATHSEPVPASVSSRRQSGRVAKKPVLSYAEDDAVD